MASSGPLYPGTGSNISGVGTRDWTLPEYITADDSNNTTAFVSASTGDVYTRYLAATNWGFAIPDGATINGLVLTIRHNKVGSGPGSYAYDYVTRLYVNGALAGDNKAVTGTSWTNNTWETITYGGSTDAWNAGLTAAYINSSAFGAYLQVKFSSGDTRDIQAYVNYMTMTVYYTAAVAAAQTRNPVAMTPLLQF